MKKLIFLLLALAPAAFGQSVTGVSGTVSDGESITLAGTSFGVKSPAAPLRYDNFEDGVLGDNLKDMDHGGWYTFYFGGARPTYSNERQRVPGEMGAIQDYTDSYNQTIGLKDMDVDTLYVSGWTYRDDFDGTAMYSENVKFWGNFTQVDGETVSPPQCRYDAYWATNSGHLYVSVEHYGDPQAASFGAGPQAHLNEWFRLERYVAIGNPGEENGKSWVAYNGDKFAEIEGVFHNTSQTYNYFMLGQYFRKEPYDNPSLPEASVKTYWGELYVDNTLARVELGNNGTFSECTHREIQIPSAWSATEITATVNQGTFEAEDIVYLFVVDADGSVSDGYPVAIGGTASAELTAPSNLRQQNRRP